MRALLLALLLLTVPLAATAEERARTLADIRAELAMLTGEMARLRRELVGTGGAAGGLDAATVLDRVQAMDDALRRLTAQTEALENRIDRITADAGNRLADLEFRLVELEGGDPSAIGRSVPLGGEAGAGAGAGAPPAAPPPAEDGPALAIGERAAFEAAESEFLEGDWEAAEVALADFAEAYPAGPLTGRALAMRAEALDNLGDPARAARAWLAAFEADPEGPAAPAALSGLGRTLGALGQVEEGCIMLEELAFRFPDSPEAAAVPDLRRSIGCP